MLSPLVRLFRVGDWSIVARVVAICVAVGLVFAGATTAIGYAKASAGLAEQGEARLESDAVVVTKAVDTWTQQHLEMAHAIAKLPAVVRFLEAGDAASAEDTEFLFALGASLKNNVTDAATGFSVLDANAIMRVSQTSTTIGNSYKQRDYYQAAIRGHDFISGVSQKMSDGSPIIFVATPVKAADGRIIGVVNASGDPAGLQRLLDAEHERTGAANAVCSWTSKV